VQPIVHGPVSSSGSKEGARPAPTALVGIILMSHEPITQSDQTEVKEA
jgi:hypothetical protein